MKIMTTLATLLALTAFGASTALACPGMKRTDTTASREAPPVWPPAEQQRG